MYGHLDSSVTWADLGCARFCDFRPSYVPLLGPMYLYLGLMYLYLCPMYRYFGPVYLNLGAPERS